MASDLDLGWVDPQLGALRRAERNLGTGLCRALAVRWGVDVLLIRGAFVVLALCGAVGIAVYAWGTALTPGRHGTRPVDVYLPRFRTWPRLTQQLFVLLSSLVATAIVSPLTPLPWALGVMVLFIALLLRRNRPGAKLAPAPTGPVSDAELVERWRERMRNAAGEPVATVDRHTAPTPAPRRRPSLPPPRASLWGGALVLLAGGGGLAVALLAGLNALAASGAALAAAGLIGLGYAATVRRRRLPGFVVGLLALSLVPAGWLATQASAAGAPAEPGVLRHEVIGTSALIDLSQDLSGYTSIEIRAVAAHVKIIVPGDATNLTTHPNFSTVLLLSTDAAPFELPVRVDAAASIVEIEERA